MYWPSALVVVGLLGLGPAAVPAAQDKTENLVANPGFEEMGPGARPAGWTIDGRLATLSADQVHGGHWALKIEDRSTKDGASARSAPFPVEPGKEYTFSAWAYFVSGSGLGLYVEFFDASGKRLEAADARWSKSMSAGTRRWRETSLVLTAPKEARRAGIWLHSYAGSTVTAFVDDVGAVGGRPAQPPEPRFKPFQPVAVKLPGPERPSLLVAKAEIPRILQKAREQPWAKDALAKLIQGADRWRRKLLSIPDRGGQWSHWYACQSDGARLRPKGPTEHVCPKCGAVYKGEPYDSVPVTGVHSDLAKAAQQLGLAYALTQDKTYADKAFEILLGYADRYQNYPLHDRNGGQARSAGRVLSQTLEEAIWLIPICCAYDCIYDSGSLGEAQRRKIETQLIRPAVEVIRRNKSGLSNWQSWHNAGLGAAALCLRDQALLEEVLNGPDGFQFQMANSVTADGFWYEGSWGYHFYALSAHVHLAEMAARAGIDLWQNPRLKSLFDAPLRFMMPNGRLPAFHDAHETSPFQPRLYESALAHWGDANYAWVLAKGRDAQAALLYGRPTIPEVDAPKVESVNFTSAGFAVLRSGQRPESLYFALDYGPHGGGHGHPDKLSFVFYGLGRVLAPDPGCVAYGLKVHRGWYKQTVAHNTIAVDQASQEPCTGRCVFFARSPRWQAVRAAADEAYQGVQMTRLAVLAEDYVVLIDELAGRERRAYDWIYHNYGRLQLDAELKLADQAEPLGNDAGYQYLTQVRRGRSKGQWGATWELEDKKLRLEMLGGPANEEVIAAVGVGTTPKEEVPMVIARRQETSAVYAAVLHPFAQQPAITARRLATPSHKSLALQIDRDGAKEVVLVSLGRQRSLCTAGKGDQAVSADAQLAVVRLGAEGMAALVVDGRTLGTRWLNLSVAPPANLYAEAGPGRLIVKHDSQERLAVEVGLGADLLGRGGSVKFYMLDAEAHRVGQLRPAMHRGRMALSLEPNSGCEIVIGDEP